MCSYRLGRHVPSGACAVVRGEQHDGSNRRAGQDPHGRWILHSGSIRDGLSRRGGSFQRSLARRAHDRTRAGAWRGGSGGAIGTRREPGTEANAISRRRPDAWDLGRPRALRREEHQDSDSSSHGEERDAKEAGEWASAKAQVPRGSLRLRVDRYGGRAVCRSACGCGVFGPTRSPRWGGSFRAPRTPVFDSDFSGSSTGSGHSLPRLSATCRRTLTLRATAAQLRTRSPQRACIRPGSCSFRSKRVHRCVRRVRRGRSRVARATVRGSRSRTPSRH